MFAIWETAKPEDRCETILPLLDRADDIRKAEFLGTALKAYVRGFVDLETFRAIATAIDRSYFDDLASLLLLQRNLAVPSEVGVRLFATGLVRQLAVLPQGGPGAFEHWGLTALGERFIHVMFAHHPGILR